MKKFIETLKNCWKIEDLRQRLLITLLFTAIYRFGSFVVLPGINPAALQNLQQQTAGGLMSLLDMFSGGAFSNASIFALGIMPYISASIVMQLLAVAVPYFQKRQREGESGRKKINWYTRVLTVIILFFQAPAYLMNLKYQAGQALASGISWNAFMWPATIILAAGSMFILWLGERITDKGVGNGVSLIIMLGIIARFPQAFAQEFTSRLEAVSGGGIIMFIAELLHFVDSFEQTSSAINIETSDTATPDTPDKPEGRFDKVDKNVFVSKGSGYLMFKGSQDTASNYAATVNGILSSLDSNIHLYNIVIPTNTEFGIEGDMSKYTNSQSDNLNKIKMSLMDGVFYVEAVRQFLRLVGLIGIFHCSL